VAGTMFDDDLKACVGKNSVKLIEGKQATTVKYLLVRHCSNHAVAITMDELMVFRFPLSFPISSQ